MMERYSHIRMEAKRKAVEDLSGKDFEVSHSGRLAPRFSGPTPLRETLLPLCQRQRPCSLVTGVHGRREKDALSASPKSGSRKFSSKSRPAVNFKMRSAKCSPPTHNCWFYANNATGERRHPTPASETTSRSARVCDLIFPIPRRWPAATRNSCPSAAVVPVHRPSATGRTFPGRRKAGAFFRTPCAGGGGNRA